MQVIASPASISSAWLHRPANFAANGSVAPLQCMATYPATIIISHCPMAWSQSTASSTAWLHSMAIVSRLSACPATSCAAYISHQEALPVTSCVAARQQPAWAILPAGVRRLLSSRYPLTWMTAVCNVDRRPCWGSCSLLATHWPASQSAELLQTWTLALGFLALRHMCGLQAATSAAVHAASILHLDCCRQLLPHQQACP